ncbi:MAG: FMN-binding protein [Clostridia bacterium]|nr:FMN-binding protein [Clostridia bacterium]
MKKDGLKSIVVLSGICLVVAVLLSVVNYITAPIIEENAANAEMGSLSAVLPDAKGFEQLEVTDAPETVTGVYREESGLGYAVTLQTSSSYSQSPMTFTLGIGADGKIVAVEMTNYAETKSFEDYPQSYVGADSALGGVDLYAGATYSSQAFKSAVEDAFSVLTAMGGIAEGQKSEEQIIAELLPVALPGAVNNGGVFKATEIEVALDIVKAAYKADNGIGYVFAVDVNGETQVCALSTTGGIRFYNLAGDVVEEENLAVANSLLAAVDVSADAENDKKQAEIAAGTAETLEKIALTEQFGTVTSAYKNGEQFIFVAKPFGYVSPMTVTFVIENGAVVSFRNSGELIQAGEYYSGFEMDEAAYINSFVGKTDAEQADMISGATITANGVKQALKDALEAYKEIAGEVA